MNTLLAAFLLSSVQGPDQCLAFVSFNLAKGNANFYTYYRFSEQKVVFKAGDSLVYSVFLDPKNPVAKGGVDVQFTDGGQELRELDIRDDADRRAHGDGNLDAARGKWLTRRFPMDKVAGRESASWNVNFEGDSEGRYVQFIDDVFVRHADGSRTKIYETGNPPARALLINNGYTIKPGLVAVPRAEVKEGASIEPLISEAAKLGLQYAVLVAARSDLDLAKKFLAQNRDLHLDGHIKEAEAALAAVENRESSPQEIQAALHTVNQALQHTHPAMERYTGHLVGHAHIDLQWLWEWQEGIVFTKDTFVQAVKFMDEFPGFTFSQSSSCLYQAMEEHYPALFKLIQAKVKKGQWEIVGGRVCEADTNLISSESHARHFLYGQRYFREKFGKIATVGWEPDTFGHTAQMPQILKLGGCDSYYFCRAGKGKPLFWWQGLDGTKTLTFEEPATGSWYNSDLSYKQFAEMLEFKEKTGSKDMLWVYGVGNHGGGPTREYIEEALKWMKDPKKPKVRFSTATEFFKKLRTYDLNQIPTISQELNPVFDGCYTTHSEIKKANRDAEAWTTTAEAVAACATFFGFKYPRANFRRNWEEIAFNHHHDTLPGSGIHAPYKRTMMQLDRVIADGKDIVTRALESIVINLTPKQGGISVLVFNPLGWQRSGWVTLDMVKSGWDGGTALSPSNGMAYGPDGKGVAVQLLNPASGLGRFCATDIPSFGYKVFQIKTRPESEPSLNALPSTQWQKTASNELAPAGLMGMGRLEVHWENPQNMSAWVIGKIDRVDSLPIVSSEKRVYGNMTQYRHRYVLKARSETEQDSEITQTFTLDPQNGMVVCDVECDWNAIGRAGITNPLLRVSFDSKLPGGKAMYEVPFGAIERPQDGIEYPALKWASISDGKIGYSVLNDSKHGFSAANGILRMSLIRSSFDPDPVPDQGKHYWRYAIVAHSGDWRTARIPQRAAEFNQPMVWATVSFDAKGPNPHEWSALSLSSPNLIATGLKMSEDDDSLVLRFFEGFGSPAKQESVRVNVPSRSPTLVNFLEDRLGLLKLENGSIQTQVRPWEIQTLKIGLDRGKGKRGRSAK